MSDNAERRPDPDALLRVIEKSREGKGKIKVFFGMAAGVGKTYAMLQEAERKRQEGTDVVIGYLESHQRKETDALASNLELVPRMALSYRGKSLQEMDTDAVVARKPQLVLVDELAHTNAPGARNRKRYQDVLELTEHGIDVFTTVNVQHLEGFADTVEEITGITIVERIPDSVFDVVDQVVLIDISPEELLKRLSEGKVYLGERAEAAAQNFFKKSTLAALREMALRHTALLVNHQLSDMLQESAPAGAPAAGEHLLVAISPSPNSAHLIRWTRQRAFNLRAEWTALYVDTGSPLGEAAQESLRKNMNLARQLGAAMVTLPSDNVPLAVIRFARSNSITEIVVGKSGMVGRAPFLRRRTIAERIMKMSGDVDVAVVQEKGAALARPRVRLTSYLRAERASISKMILVIAAVTGVNLLALPVIGYRSASILYLLAIIALAFFSDRLAVLIGAGVSAVLWDFFFLPPRFTFLITKLEDVLMFFLYFVTAAALAFLMSRLRLNQRMLGVRARRMSLLLDFSQSLARQTSLEWNRGGGPGVCHALSRGRGDRVPSRRGRRAPDGSAQPRRHVGGREGAGRSPLVLRQQDPLRQIHGHAAHGAVPLHPAPDAYRGGRCSGSTAAEGCGVASRPGGFPPDARPHPLPFHRKGAAGGGKPQEPDGARIGASRPRASEHCVPRAAHAAYDNQGVDHRAHGPRHRR